MIDLLSTMQVVLREAGFNTHLTSVDRSPIVRFEDETLMGFGCIFRDPDDLLSRWKSMEMSLLKLYASSFRAAGEKAWNVYCLFLSGSEGDSVQSRQVRWIEENLDRTRKIAACGLASREHLIRALLPILPLQSQPVLEAEDTIERLQRRISAIAPKASDVALDESMSAVEVVRLLGE
jgi:hypothetical protein